MDALVADGGVPRLRRARAGRPPYSASQKLQNLASVGEDNRIVFCTLERPPSKIATLSAVRFPVASPAIPVEPTDIPGIPKLWSGKRGHDWAWRFAWQGNSSAIGMSAVGEGSLAAAGVPLKDEGFCDRPRPPVANQG